MPVIVQIKGALEPLILDEDLAETFQSINMSAASGRKFVVADGMDGSAVLISLDQILTIKEIDPQDPACLLA